MKITEIAEILYYLIYKRDKRIKLLDKDYVVLECISLYVKPKWQDEVFKRLRNLDIEDKEDDKKSFR